MCLNYVFAFPKIKWDLEREVGEMKSLSQSGLKIRQGAGEKES